MPPIFVRTSQLYIPIHISKQNVHCLIWYAQFIIKHQASLTLRVRSVSLALRLRVRSGVWHYAAYQKIMTHQDAN